MKSAWEAAYDEKRFTKLPEDGDDFLFSQRRFQSSTSVLPVLLCVSVAQLRIFTSTEDSGIAGKFGGNEK